MTLQGFLQGLNGSVLNPFATKVSSARFRLVGSGELIRGGRLIRGLHDIERQKGTYEDDVSVNWSAL